MNELSVVIPCYNARKSIIRAIKSLENDLINVEVIIVEDCSVHSCEDLIRDYAQESSLSIRYFQNEMNLGAGRTRNRGIKEATKEYITFLDSDDEFSSSFFKEINDPMKSGYDEIIFNAERSLNTGKQIINMLFSNNFHEGEIKEKDALVYVRGCTCGKIYKTSVIRENKVEFGEMPRNEDLVFTKVATSYMKKVFFVNKPLYIYYDNDESLMNDRSLITPRNAIDAFTIIERKLSDRELEKELNSIRLIEVLYSTTNSYIELNKTNSEIKRNYNNVRKEYNSKDPYRKGYSIVYQVSYFFFELRLFGIYKKVRAVLRGR